MRKTLSYISLLVIVLLNNEYVIPDNSYVPKIGQIIDSFVILIKDYDLPISFLYTLSTFYLSFAVFYILSLVIFPLWNSWMIISGLQQGIKINKWFLSLFAGLFFLIWFPNSQITGIIFLFLVYIADLTGSLAVKYPLYYRNTIQPALTLGLPESKTITRFTRELVKVNGLGVFRGNHSKYWTIILLFEFFNPERNSIGSLLRISYEYWSVPFLTAVVLLTILIIAMMAILLKTIANKTGIRHED
ncbi:MAG: hypothetical protein AB9882_05570 [Ignavibacteriaceae bacterium]